MDERKAKQDGRDMKERQETMFEEMIDIANEDCKESRCSEKGNEYTVTDAAKVQHQRLKIDAQKWVLGKMNPKKYGDTTRHKHSGDEDDDTPIKIIGTIIK